MDRRKRSLSWRSVLGLTLAAGSFGLAAVEPDEPGCRDHPLFSRMKDYHIGECSSKPFDSLEVYVGEDKTITVEGKKTVVNYAFDREDGAPSPLQVTRNYANAVRAIGGSVVYDWRDGVTLKLARDGRELWAVVDTANGGFYYDLTVVERGAMAQEVTANDMMSALQKDGFMALYINFDSGQATIRSESRPLVDEVAGLLRRNPSLRLSIEGHTDNVGTPAANKLLSERRAKAVLDAVVSSGVAAARLSAAGWGQERPIADNRSEEGRAKNRRVEIVKK
jgi:outer membrane protein OmpA-like peptidoglycan-associated protein